MKVLLIGAAFNNATDGNINRGILNLFKMKYSNFSYDYVFINDHDRMHIDDFNPSLPYDAIMVCGTPWLWDQFQHSHKYKNFLLARAAHPECKIIFMGIGTCLNISDINSDILRRHEDASHLQEIFSNATVIVRDQLAFHILKYHNIESNLLPCPAFWAHTKDIFIYPLSSLPPVIIWYDPRYGISGADWQNEQKYKAYCKLFTDFYTNNKDVIVYCTDSRDISGCTSIGLPSPILLTSSEDSRNAVRFASQVLSGRVHCAIPAKAMGVPTYLVPVDSRARCMYDFGEYDGYDKYLKQYMEII